MCVNGQRNVRTAGPGDFEAVVGEDVSLNEGVVQRRVRRGAREEREQEDGDCGLHVFEAW